MLGAVAALLVLLASCSLAPDHCLRMSDCGDGTTCVEGLCTGGDVPPAEALSTNGDASSLPEAAVKPATDAAAIDAGHSADAGDGAVTDAPTGG
ncbi:hypothetical protein BH11MYX4_BH11MYX4_45010 [soil metagenome]